MKAEMTDVQRVYEVMKSGDWFVPHAVRMAVGYRFGEWMSAESVTARIRDQRKARYGGFKVRRQRVTGTKHYEYRLELQMSLLDAFPSAHLEVLISERELEATR